MIKRFQNYIETSTWDELDDDTWRLIDLFCRSVAILGGLYFGVGYLLAYLQGAFS